MTAQTEQSVLLQWILSAHAGLSVLFAGVLGWVATHFRGRIGRLEDSLSEHREDNLKTYIPRSEVREEIDRALQPLLNELHSIREGQRRMESLFLRSRHAPSDAGRNGQD